MAAARTAMAITSRHLQPILPTNFSSDPRMAGANTSTPTASPSHHFPATDAQCDVPPTRVALEAPTTAPTAGPAMTQATRNEVRKYRHVEGWREGHSRPTAPTRGWSE